MSARKLSKRKIRADFFAYKEEVERNGKKVVTVRRAFRGDEVELSPENIKRGDAVNAFEPLKSSKKAQTTKEDQAPVAGGDPAADPSGTSADPQVDGPDISSMSDDELSKFLEEREPNEGDTVAMAGDDPELAERLLSAESAATGGSPRKGVSERLQAIIDNKAS